MAVEKLKIN